jgi:4-hydroxy-tetrahydrodipicolinate synthase
MIAGSIVALVTPMHSDGRIDWEHLDQLVSMHVEQGTGGIVAVGTTGESATLDVSEHCEVIKRVVQLVAGRIPVIAGTGANSTREAIELTAAAKSVNADACLLVTPYYNKPSQEGLFLHHKAIAEAVAIPQLLYNVPGRTACDMLPETVARLADIPNIIGIKEATGDMQRGRKIMELCGDRMILLSGDDATFVDLMELGARGNISVTANVAPAQMAAVCDAALGGDFVLARKLNEPLQGLHSRLFLEANPIPVKWALFEMAYIEEGIRLPLTPLNEKYYGKLREAMQMAGIL